MQANHVAGLRIARVSYYFASIRLRNAQITTNLASKKFMHFGVARNAGGCAGVWIPKDRVTGALGEQFTTMSRKMADQIAPLHCEA
jgi:hypothetical protein